MKKSVLLLVVGSVFLSFCTNVHSRSFKRRKLLRQKTSVPMLKMSPAKRASLPPLRKRPVFAPLSKNIKLVKQNRLGSSLELKKSYKMDTNNMRDGSAYLEYFLARYATGGAFNAAQFTSNTKQGGGQVRIYLTPVVPGDYLVECLVSKARKYTIATQTARTEATAPNDRLVFVLSCLDRQKVAATISGSSENTIDGYWYFHGCKITLIKK